MVLSDYQASYWLKSDSHPPKNCSQHSMVMLLLLCLVAHLARCESRRFVCLPPSCDSTVLSARASSAFLRARLSLPPCLLTTFCHPLLAAYIVHPTTIHGVRQHRTCKEVPSHAEEERVNSYPFSPSASLPAPDARAVSAHQSKEGCLAVIVRYFFINFGVRTQKIRRAYLNGQIVSEFVSGCLNLNLNFRLNF